MKKIVYISVILVSTALFGEDAKVVSPTEKAMQDNAPDVGSDHTLSEILGGGRVVILEDGSQWEVHPDDVDKAGGWLGPADVVLSPSKDAAYKYQIYNDWTNSSVRVRPYTPPPASSGK